VRGAEHESTMASPPSTWYSHLLNRPLADGEEAARPPAGPRRILVSGTTGWIAGGVAAALAREGHDVSGIARRPTVIDGVESIQADLLSAESLKQVGAPRAPYDVLLHLGGSLGWASLEQAIEINVAGTRKLVQAAIDNGCTRVVVASSVAATGWVAPAHPPAKLPLAVDARFVGSNWAYALSKSMVEELVAFMSLENPTVEFLVLRVGATVTDPPDIVHKDGEVDGKEVSWPVEPARVTAQPYSKTKLFAEDALCAIAYSDQVDAFVHCAVRAPVRPGVRQIACVAPRLYAEDTVPELMRSWYGEAIAATIDMRHYDDPAHAKDPIYDLAPARALGWSPRVDLLGAKGL
jgi:nucleoside-diphosphate-sugar epimerase